MLKNRVCNCIYDAPCTIKVFLKEASYDWLKFKNPCLLKLDFLLTSDNYSIFLYN